MAGRDRSGRGAAGGLPSHLSRASGFMGRAGWNLVDQVLSSGTNAALSIVVARSVDAAGFGAFSVAFLLFALLIAVARALAGQVLSIRHSATDEGERARVASRALGTVSVLAGAAGTVLVAAGALVGGQLRWPLVALGVTLVPLLLQDTVRCIFFARSRADLAALNDGIWAVAAFGALGALLGTGRTEVGGLVLAWGATSSVAVAVALVQVRALPDPTATLGWVRQHRDLLVYLLPETLITSGGDKVAYLVIGHLVDLSAVGSVNAARQILNPLLVVSSAAVSFALPEVSRRAHLSPRWRWRIASALGAVQAVAALAYTGLVLVMPEAIGAWAFHDTWRGAREVLLPMGLFSALAGLCLGPFLVIAAMGHAARSFRVTSLQVALTVVLMPLGAVLGGAPGSAWGLVVAKLVEVPFWLVTLRTVVRLGPARGRDHGPGEAGTAGEAGGQSRVSGAGR